MKKRECWIDIIKLHCSSILLLLKVELVDYISFVVPYYVLLKYNNLFLA